MPPRLHLDVETCAEPWVLIKTQGSERRIEGVDLKKDGVWNYARHSGTHVYLFAFKIGLGSTAIVHLWGERQGPTGEERYLKSQTQLFQAHPELPKFLNQLASGAIVVAHNAAFEREIWNFIIRRYFPDWPPILLESQDCTMARAHAMGLPGSLEGVCNALRLPIRKGDKSVMERLMYHTPFDPVRVSRNELEELGIYCGLDVDAEEQLDRTLYPLTPIQRRVWLLDQRINEGGIPVDKPNVLKALKLVEPARESANNEIERLTGGAVRTAQQAGALLDWLHGRGHAELTSVAQHALETHEEEHGWRGDEAVARVLLLREAASRASVAKFQAIADQLRMTPDNRLRYQFVVFGTHTGGWAGRAVQPQNLRRFDDDTPEMARKLMACLELPGTEVLLAPTGWWPMARKINREIEKQCGENVLIVLGKCLRAFVKAA